MGSDLTVANAARVSMGRKSEWDLVEVEEGFVCKESGTVRAYCEIKANGRTDMFQEATDLPPLPPGCGCEWQDGAMQMVLREKDVRLIKFLAREKHVMPFAHPQVQFHFRAPIFVARQLAKHQVGMVWSEISRRYVSGEPEFYWPEVWRKGSPDVKQGSLDEGVDDAVTVDNWKRGTELHAKNVYAALGALGVAPELARMVLPQNTYTEWHWTGSLLAWSRVWGLRVAEHAQAETREIVKMIGPKMEGLFPVSWEELTK